MSSDFWAGYISGAVGILVGNPLDLIKTRLQAGPAHGGTTTTAAAATSNTLAASTTSSAVAKQPLLWTRHFEHWTSLARGAAAPILGYGALNALLFVTYNRSLAVLNGGTASIDSIPTQPTALSVWTAGALGGFATFFVSAPTELVKCRAQVSEPARSSWEVTRELWGKGGVRGLYLGGGITSVRDAVGYGFYFWSYHLSKRAFENDDGEPVSPRNEAIKVLLCGGLAGVVTWASIFPLDVIKTRIQTFDLRAPTTSPTHNETSSLLNSKPTQRPSTLQIAKDIYRIEGVGVFFRGLGVCSARAFIVNAIQWAMYEWVMKILNEK